MSSAEADGDSGGSSDERDLGWGGREWADSRDGGEGGDGSDGGEGSDGSGGRDVTEGSGDSEDPELERLRADRPPHHEERER